MTPEDTAKLGRARKYIQDMQAGPPAHTSAPAP